MASNTKMLGEAQGGQVAEEIRRTTPRRKGFLVVVPDPTTENTLEEPGPG